MFCKTKFFLFISFYTWVTLSKAFHDPSEIPPEFIYAATQFSEDGRTCEKCMFTPQGENLPTVNWNVHPGPCYPPEEPDCRGTPYNLCWRWWIPCGYYSIIEFWPCCWTDGGKATSVCRQPELSAEEYYGSRHYKYCLPLLGPDGRPRRRGGSKVNQTIQYGPEGAGNNFPLEPSEIVPPRSKANMDSSQGGVPARGPTHQEYEQKMLQHLTKIAEKLETKKKNCPKKKNHHN